MSVDLNTLSRAELQAQLLKLIQSQRIPAVAAPMFLVSSPELTIACSKAGVVGSIPAPNARTVEQLDQWLAKISTELGPEQNQGKSLPWLLNMIVHSTYNRFDAEVELVKRYKPALVTTALGSPKRVLSTVHGYGGLVMADVITPAMARKAVDAGVDGVILVCSGAGGHTGLYNPFSFLAEVREFWDGPIGLAGGVSNGADIHAARVMGYDFVLVGTRLIPAAESMVSDEYRQMLLDSTIEDIVPSKSVSGVLANWLKPSLERAGFDLRTAKTAEIDFSGDMAADTKAWKHIWSAGQGVGQIKSLYTAAELIDELEAGYLKSLARKI
ncbi:MAG TPA: nitronate monooxygenase [Alcaligenaceae bacterium]|nr:nitronate monooxygenase [Alcaligenaceae bacterium]